MGRGRPLLAQAALTLAREWDSDCDIDGGDASGRPATGRSLNLFTGGRFHSRGAIEAAAAARAHVLPALVDLVRTESLTEGDASRSILVVRLSSLAIECLNLMLPVPDSPALMSAAQAASGDLCRSGLLEFAEHLVVRQERRDAGGLGGGGAPERLSARPVVHDNEASAYARASEQRSASQTLRWALLPGRASGAENMAGLQLLFAMIEYPLGAPGASVQSSGADALAAPVALAVLRGPTGGRATVCRLLEELRPWAAAGGADFAADGAPKFVHDGPGGGTRFA